MPIVFGEPANSVAEIVTALKKHGDRVRGAYRSRYRYDRGGGNPYAAPSLERPAALSEEPASRIYPWEQIFVAAATCAGSDYPMLANHAGIPLERVELVVEGVFDPRGEFEGLDGLEAPPDARPCFLNLHLKASIVSTAPRAELEKLHERVVTRNMVLGALRGVPMTSEAHHLRGLTH